MRKIRTNCIITYIAPSGAIAGYEMQLPIAATLAYAAAEHELLKNYLTQLKGKYFLVTANSSFEDLMEIKMRCQTAVAHLKIQQLQTRINLLNEMLNPTAYAHDNNAVSFADLDF